MTTTELASAGARKIAALVAARRSSPVEVVRATLAPAEAPGPRLDAFQILLAEQAKAARMRGDAPGPPHGVPARIKDVHAVAGLPMRRGSPLTEETPEHADAPLVARPRGAGAITLGKPSRPDRGWTATSEGPLSGATRGPWKRVHTAGGSAADGAGFIGLRVLGAAAAFLEARPFTARPRG